MKITHRNPAGNWFHVPQSAAVDPVYEAEVRRSTERAEHEYRRRQERLARAEARLASARKAPRKVTRKQMTELQAIVELRRCELEEYRRAMAAAPASAEHRGRKSYRPVPPVQGIPL